MEAGSIASSRLYNRPETSSVNTAESAIFCRALLAGGLTRWSYECCDGSRNSYGNYLVGHLGINKVSFTGSTSVGKQVGNAGMENINHQTLELSGKSAILEASVRPAYSHTFGN